MVASDLLLPALLVFHFVIKPYRVQTGWATGKIGKHIMRNSEEDTALKA